VKAPRIEIYSGIALVSLKYSTAFFCINEKGRKIIEIWTWRSTLLYRIRRLSSDFQRSPNDTDILYRSLQKRLKIKSRVYLKKWKQVKKFPFYVYEEKHRHNHNQRIGLQQWIRPHTMFQKRLREATSCVDCCRLDARCMRADGWTRERGQRARWLSRQQPHRRLGQADTDSETISTSTSSGGGWCVFRRRRAPRDALNDGSPARPMLPSLSLVFYVATSLVVFVMTYSQPAHCKYSNASLAGYTGAP